MPLSEKQAEERRIRKQAATERTNRGLILVQRGDWWGIYATENDDAPELISRDRKVAERALALRRQDDPNWRNV
jgi:hypothetical protein